MRKHKEKIMNFVIVFTSILLFLDLTRLHDLVFFKYLCICNYAISAVVVILLNYKKFIKKEYYKQNYLLIFIILSYIIGIIYYGFNINSIKDFIYLLYFLIIVATLYDKKEEIVTLVSKYIFYTGLIINTLSLILGLLEALNMKFLPFSIIETRAGNFNFYGLYTNPNALGISSLVVLILYYSFNKNKKMIINIGCLLLFIAFILVSGSRASLVSVIIYFIMFFIIKRYHPTKTLISKIFIILVTLFLGITTFLSFTNSKKNEFVGMEKTLNSLTTNRYMLWKYSLVSVDNIDKVFWGIPSSNIGLERYKKIPDKIYFSFENYTQNLAKSNNTHNGYIQLFISSGVICGILMLLWIYKGLKNTEDVFIPIITSILCLNMFENELFSSRSIILFLLCYLLYFKEVGVINKCLSFFWSKVIYFKNKLGIRDVKSIFNKLKTTGFFSIFISSIFGKVVVFLGNILLARLLSKSDYGLYAYIFNCFAVLTLMGDFGVSSSAMQYITENLNSEKEQFKYLKYAVFLGSLFSVISGILILTSPIFYPYTIAESSTIVQMFFLIPLFSTLANIFAIILRAHQQNKKFAYYNFFTVFVNYVLIVPLTYFVGIKGVVYATYGYYLFSLLFAIYLSRNYLKKFFYKYTIKTKEKFDFIKFSFIMQLNITLSHLLLIIDTFVIGLIISDSNTIATYKVANSIPQALAFIPTCVVIYILPYFIKHNKERKWLNANLKKIIKYGGLVYGIFSLGIILFSKLIIGLLYGAQYNDAVLPFIILIIGFFFNATFTVPCSSIMQGLRKVNINLYISVISLVLNLVLNFIFINLFGFVGVAITTTLIQIITSIYYLVYLRKKVL